MLKRIKGNLIDLAEQGEFDVLVHGANCQNVMGSGIAKEIRERYPAAFNEDWRWDQRVYNNPLNTDDRIWKLGNYTFSDVNTYSSTKTPFTIVNAYTQVHYLPRGVDHFEYDSFKLILRKLAAVYPGKRFGFPYIGMGLAGGDKDRIIAMLEDFAETVSAQGGAVALVEFG